MDDYGAYYRRVRDSLAKAVVSGAAPPYPEPCDYCEVCRWRERCDARRRADDHLSLVANMTKVQIEELKRQGVETMAALAATPLPLGWKPARGAPASYERIREQARIQVEGRAAGRILHELLPAAPGIGLARLPEPSPGDVFFDLEGDPFVGERGIEFLFGYAYAEPDGSLAYVEDWAFSREAEKAVFERFVDFVIERLKTHPDLHIYHYAPYEPAALKRLMGRYASREEEIDLFLRSQRFVDLFGVVRGGLAGERRELFDQAARAALRLTSATSRSPTPTGRCSGFRRISSSTIPTSTRPTSMWSRVTIATTASPRRGCATGWRSSGRR